MFIVAQSVKSCPSSVQLNLGSKLGRYNFFPKSSDFFQGKQECDSGVQKVNPFH